MLSFFSSFFSSMSTVQELITSWGDKPIASCVLGISKKDMNSNLINNIPHAALLLLNKVIDYDDDKYYSDITKRDGILIEYGDYSQDNSRKGNVIYRYRYGDNGGLRYYVKKYGEFVKEFGNIGYVELNIEQNNRLSFDNLIDNIAKLEDNKWIKSKYSIFGLNSHSFVIEALKIIKPYFEFNNIYTPDPNLDRIKSLKKLDFIPSNIKEELKNYYRRI